jgi:hypothetical protein
MNTPNRTPVKRVKQLDGTSDESMNLEPETLISKSLDNKE